MPKAGCSVSRHAGWPLHDESMQMPGRNQRRGSTVSRIVMRLGTSLIVLGYLTLSFVGYTLWGTALSEQRAQRALSTSFDAEIAAAGPTAPTTSQGALDPAEPAEVADSREVEFFTASEAQVKAGEPLARLWIPRIGLERLAVHGTTYGDLKSGPGHFAKTVLPGHVGNTAFAGHRTTYGAPFGRLEELQRGDSIWVRTVEGQFRYEVTEQHIVAPSDVWVVKSTDESVITLVTCHPRWSDSSRLIVRGKLVGESVESFRTQETVVGSLPDAVSAPVTNTTVPPTQIPPTTVTVDQPPITSQPQSGSPSSLDTIESTPGGGTDVANEAVLGSWATNSAAWIAVVGWSLVMLAAWVGTKALWRRGSWRRLAAVGCVMGGLVAQWMWCANLTSIVPASL